jgi:general nucleoside transport system permease protein
MKTGGVKMIKISQIPVSGLKRNTIIRLSAIFLSLCFSGILLVFLGHNPLRVYASMLDGGLGSLYRFQETIVRTIPLVITSIGIGLSFRMRFWNIGGEGQIMMGAVAASWVALFNPEIPRPLLLLLMAAAGMAGGGLWALFPAFFKTKFKTNETIFTLMMNYVALKIVTYLQYGPWRDKEAFGYPKIPNFVQNARLPKLFDIHIGWILVPVIVTVIYLFIKYTKAGYEINVIGESESTARYAGMNVPFIILSTLFASGAICGLAGMIQVSGVNSTLSVDVTNGVGYTAIIISWLGQLNAVAILLVSFLFAVLVEGGSFIQTVYHIPEAAASLLQGIILFFVLGCEFFIKYRVSTDDIPGIKLFSQRKNQKKRSEPESDSNASNQGINND